MLKIDRMEIDDIGGNPSKLAAAIVKQLPRNSDSIPVRDIAAAIDIYEIREEPLVGLEGALIVHEDKSEGAILIHSKRRETRKRYTIAHEIGHYVNPFHRCNSPDGFRCRTSDMSVEGKANSDRFLKMEAEANQFAADLLMPPPIVTSFLDSRSDIDIQHILDMAKRFEVSKEAAARRYLEYTKEDVAVVFSKDNKIRYIKAEKNFPRLSVWNGHPLPTDSLSNTSNMAIGTVTDWSEIDGSTWLDSSYGYSVFEQTLAQQNGYRISLVTAESDESDEYEDFEVPAFAR